MLKKNHSKKLSIPCLWICPDKTEDSDGKHKSRKKFKSGRNSPLKHLKKLSVPQMKCFTRQHSPKDSVSSKTSIHKLSQKPKVPSHIVTKKKPVKKSGKVEDKLCVLQNHKILKKAPKIFENQIFCDVYDENGRHDRIMETESSLASQKSPRFIFDHVQVPLKTNAGPKPPENSFLEETCQDSFNMMNPNCKLDLLSKLKQMSEEREKDL